MINAAVGESHWVLGAVSRFQQPLIAYAVNFLGDVDRARDIVQETFLRLCTNADRCEEERVAPWLFKVCRNLAIDVLRKEKRMTSMDQAPPEVQSPERRDCPAEVQAEANTMLGILATLPETQQEVVRLKFLHDLSYREIAEVTGMSVSNVGYHIHTGLKTIRTKLEDRAWGSGAYARPPSSMEKEG